MQIKEVTPFTDLPINFKELNHSDFENYVFENEDKTIIEPDKQGYISDKLNEVIELYKKDTTIINASVGQGKTTAIIKCIEKYYKSDKNYTIIVATPSKSLVNKYIKDIEEVSNIQNICFDYQCLEALGITDKNFKNYYTKQIQVISIHSLLGNPGKIAVKQSNIKRKYYEGLIEFCKKNNRRVVVIFDEIHEAIDCFQEKFIFNLYKWREVIHKIIISSATYNEASKVVVKYLAELTNKKIKIVESTRCQNVSKLSDLHICFYDQFHIDVKNGFLIDLIEKQIPVSSKIHILSYSKKISKQIFNSKIGTILNNAYGEINLCVSGGNQYVEDKCNIGTTFRTGVNIDDENCSFFIIMPPKLSYMTPKGGMQMGLFSEGIISLIQALARPRKKSNIFVITPSPDKLILIPNKPVDYIAKTSLNYLPFDLENYQLKYYDINEQNRLLKDFYKSEKENISEEIAHVNEKELEIVPKFPDYDIYKLEKGEDYFKQYYDIFGKNLSNYFYWAAWNNQFVNCKLKNIIIVSTIKFEEGSIQEQLSKYYSKTFFNGRASYFTFYSDKDCYIKFRLSLFSNRIKYKHLKKEKYKIIAPYRNTNFEKQIITFIQRIKREFNFNILKLIYPPDGNRMNARNGKFISWKKPFDLAIELNTYLRICMAYSIELMMPFDKLSNQEEHLIRNYQSLYKFKDILLNDYSITNKKGELLLPKDSKIDFKKNDSIELKSIFNTLKENDSVLKSFSFLQKNADEKAIYSFIKKLFFEIKDTTFEESKYSRIISQIELPEKSHYINLIYSMEHPWILQPGYDVDIYSGKSIEES
ncbi:DEAD/DEAH box helicase family protein [Apibacter adventoris]|uniref:Helicase ATP-binding domain-containing protein n=1 Tax=Apibacter adventoris TaxID=1679466 RepID=A0A2S8AAP1_9FLAO|nr:DEAD/DEAH box helicase family protein [Apibacter adventoris]PQL91665.1 hypothetical protein C4S77_07640 [Apibacter adventoris]